MPKRPILPVPINAGDLGWGASGAQLDIATGSSQVATGRARATMCHLQVPRTVPAADRGGCTSRDFQCLRANMFLSGLYPADSCDLYIVHVILFLAVFLFILAMYVCMYFQSADAVIEMSSQPS